MRLGSMNPTSCRSSSMDATRTKNTSGPSPFSDTTTCNIVSAFFQELNLSKASDIVILFFSFFPLDTKRTSLVIMFR
jgi:hypothetical protein